MPYHKMIPISKLMVNPSNPRFEPVQDQGQAIQTMLSQAKKSIKALANDIAKSGLNPIKIIAVVPNGQKYIVLEGNRRIIALKLLNNPGMTQDVSIQSFFKKLKANYQIPSSVYCTVFDNKAESKHWIILEHTGQNNGVGVVSWNTIQQARFNDKPSKLIQIAKYTGSDLNTTHVDQTNLERLISTPYVRAKIGIRFSKGEIKEEKPRTDILKNLGLVVSAMSKEGFTVRDIDHAKDRKLWIDQILDAKHQSTSDTRTAKPQSSRDSPKSSDREHLIPSECVLSIKESRINDIFLELKNDLVLQGKKSTPNATAVLFRVFLETSIDKYIKTAGITMHDKPKMKEKINKITEHMIAAKIATDEQLKAIRSTSTSPDAYFLNIQWFHQYVHNSGAYPDSGSLKAKWNNLQEFFEILWAFINKIS